MLLRNAHLHQLMLEEHQVAQCISITKGVERLVSMRDPLYTADLAPLLEGLLWDVDFVLCFHIPNFDSICPWFHFQLSAFLFARMHSPPLASNSPFGEMSKLMTCPVCPCSSVRRRVRRRKRLSRMAMRLFVTFAVIPSDYNASDPCLRCFCSWTILSSSPPPFPSLPFLDEKLIVLLC